MVLGSALQMSSEASGSAGLIVWLDEPTGQQTAWYLTRELGKGGFATVFEAEGPGGRRAACKVIQADCLARKARARQEIEALQAAQPHRHVVTFLGSRQCGQFIFILQELRCGDILDEVLRQGGLAEAHAKQVVQQLLQALVHLHRDRSIIHGDVKPENILCGQALDDLQLADFGSAIVQGSHPLPSTDMALSMGTALYASPEVHRAEPVSFASDMWSVGVVTYVLLSGCFPFSSKEDSQVHQPSFASDPWTSRVAASGHEFIMALLQHEPTQRLTAEEALQHPWMRPTSRCTTPLCELPLSDLLEMPCTPPKKQRRLLERWVEEGGELHQPKPKKARLLHAQTQQARAGTAAG